MERHKDPCPLDIQYTWRSRPLSVSPYPPLSPFAAADQPPPYDLTSRSLLSLTSRATQSLSTSSPSHWPNRVLVVSGDGAHGTITVCSSPHMSLISSLSLLNHTCSFPPSPHSCLTIVPLYLVVFLPRRTFSSSGTGFFPPASCPLLLAAWLCSRQQQNPDALLCFDSSGRGHRFRLPGGRRAIAARAPPQSPLGVLRTPKTSHREQQRDR